MHRMLLQKRIVLVALLGALFLPSFAQAAESEGAQADSSTEPNAASAQVGDQAEASSPEGQTDSGSSVNPSPAEKSGPGCFRERNICPPLPGYYPIPTSLRPQGVPEPYGPWTFTSGASKCGLKLCFPYIVCECGVKLLNSTCGF